MSKKLQFLSTILFLVLSINSGQAQDLFAKANKQFQLGAYDLAIYNYQKILKNDSSNADVIGNLAEAYFRTQNYMEAIRWYEELVTNEFMEPRHMLNYAHVMKSLGQYDKAQIWYWKYKTINPEVGDHFAMSCDHAKFFLQSEENYDISLFNGNTPSSDFGVSFYNDKLIYCSFRTDMKREKGKRNFSHVQKEGNQLFICKEKNDAKFTNTNFLRSDLKEIHNIGPLIYSGSKVAMTKNNFADGYKQITGTETDLNIFIGEVADANGDFENDIPFQHNERGSSTAFPAFMNNGNTLIFSSNRIGGSGKFDLYKSELVNGEWSTPVNIGAELNTPGNEITPSIHGNTLYFSSDYHSGIGGYDIFKATISASGNISGVENLGKGVNSPMDDYYYTIDPANGVGYFASTRLGGKGKEDIYLAMPLNVNVLAYNDPVDLNIPKAVNLEELAASRPIQTENSIATTVANKEEAITKKEDIAVPAVIIEEETSNVELFDTEENTVLNTALIPNSDVETVVAENISVEEVVVETAVVENMDVEKTVVENTVVENTIVENKVVEEDLSNKVEIEETAIILTEENVITNISTKDIDYITEELIAENVINETVSSAIVTGTGNLFNLDGAKKVAYRDVITAASNVYFIQLASLSRSKGDIRPFLKLSELGNLYKVNKGGTVKIRMGYFFDEYEATDKLREIKSRGFRDAFVVYEPLITSQLELVNNGTNKTYYEGEFIPTGAMSNYKIRLASYTDPLWFDTGSVKDIGEIEQWTKGDFTIFVLSGYNSVEDAESALIKAINRGYTEAHLVEDVNGYLQKVQRN